MKQRGRLGVFFAGAALVAAALAFFVSPHASSAPDGLNRVAIDQGFDASETDHALSEQPTAGYSVRGISSTSLATGVAGLIGVVTTAAIAGGLVLGLRRTRRGRTEADGVR